MGDNIENIIVGEVQQIIKKSVGRPIRPIKSENETTPKKKEYYVKKNTKSTGRPITKTPEELKQNARRLEKEYNLRRGHLIGKIKYIIEKYENIPEELKTLPQSTQEELQNKYLKLYDYYTEIKKNKILNRPPDYVKIATKKYYMKKKEEDPNFMKKKIEQSKKWREENREKYNEIQKLINRERRAKKIIEKENAERLINTEVNNI